MKTVFHAANTRGHANHGWLDTSHTFSFASYYNPERVHFGALRVLNDDKIAGGTGFGTHPHDNMEIISIPLDGDLAHKDSMGNGTVIRTGEIQVMSAGTGIQHSEYNANEDKTSSFLQIWVFPNKRQVEPRYDQLRLDEAKMKNQLAQILSPNADDEGVWIHQNAWFSMGKLDAGTELSYEVHDPNNGIYVFLLDGELEVSGQKMQRRDGFGIWETSNITLKTIQNAHVLLMEVPMEI